jgi:hypothetical protein
VKLMVLLRNPVDRALSSYNMKTRVLLAMQKLEQQQQRRNDGFSNYSSSSPLQSLNGHDIPTFDDYVRMDVDALYETGVLQDWTKVDFETFSGSAQEFLAWQAYLNSGLSAPVGMGLYSIMLRHLFRQMERHGKSIADDFLAIQSEQFQNNTNEYYGTVLDFLGLTRISLARYPSSNKTPKEHKELAEQQMTPETEQLLRDVFEPYNRALATLLGSDWEGVWTR